MELKDLVKGVIADITNAVEESQKELGQGIVNPGALNNTGGHETRDYYINNIEFDVAISSSSDVDAGLGIRIFPIRAGANASGKDSESARIKFSVPVAYPREVHVKQENTEHKEQPSYFDGATGTVTQNK